MTHGVNNVKRYYTAKDYIRIYRPGLKDCICSSALAAFAADFNPLLNPFCNDLQDDSFR
jgi:hypothetical protein